MGSTLGTQGTPFLGSSRLKVGLRPNSFKHKHLRLEAYNFGSFYIRNPFLSQPLPYC